MKKSLLLVSIKQFGYSNVYFHHCKYLKQYFDITYLCLDQKLPKIESFDFRIVYINSSKNNLITPVLFILKVMLFIKKNTFDILVISNYYFMFLVKIFFPKRNYSLDIRVGHKGINAFINRLYRMSIKLNAFFFRRCTVLSSQLAKELNLDFKNIIILPLGSDRISTKKKDFSKINLLYIGTFNNRNIPETIEGFKKFYDNFKNYISVKYTIVGFGNKKEIDSINNAIDNYKLHGIVQYVGRKKINERSDLFDTHNIGVSYIPKTKLYDSQPPTKTLEYLLSGMPVIATSTAQNKKIIGNKNGVLIDDDPESFFNGLKIIYHLLPTFDSGKIVSSSDEFLWSKIVLEKYLPYLLGLIKN